MDGIIIDVGAFDDGGVVGDSEESPRRNSKPRPKDRGESARLKTAGAPELSKQQAARKKNTLAPSSTTRPVPSHLKDLGLSFKTKMKLETKTRSVPVQRTRTQTKTRQVPVTRMRTEDRTRIVDGKEQKYQVQVPYTENVTQNYTVQVPYTEQVSQSYSVQVPVAVVSLEESKADEIIAQLVSNFDLKLLKRIAWLLCWPIS